MPTSDVEPRTSDRPFRAGYVAVIGRPNVGKSTLTNRLVGQKLCIVSPKPQTTWHRILGIRTLPGAQLLFLDTPGIHRSEAAFNQALVRAALTAMADADVILWLLDATEPEHPDDELILEELRRRPPRAPVMLVLNKVDAIQKDLLLPLIDRWREAYVFAAIVPISAAGGANVDRLEALTVERLPESPPFYPPEELTDRPERFFIAEILRERVFHLLRQELPYAAAVQVESVRQREGRDLTDVAATIFVEKVAQKGIVIGGGGQMRERIGTQSRPPIEALLGMPVFLELQVKVLEGWRKDPAALKRFGYLEG
ncbi:MAG: GTPase Era [Planctomycetota bacterium]|nr:MAG: GTPase Era [Planctomycetota bacterium]